MLLEQLARRLPQLKGRGMVNMWGMTEGGGFYRRNRRGSALLPDDGGPAHYPPSSCASTNPMTTVPARSWFAAPLSCSATSACRTARWTPGWLRSGDLGHLNDEGYLFIDGRSKDMVIRAGRTSPRMWRRH